MISPKLMNTPIQVLRADPKHDRYNNETLDWATASVVATKRGLVAPRPLVAQAEDLDSRDLSATEAYIYLPPKTDVLPTDRLLVQGLTYEIRGLPQVVAPHYLVCVVRATKG